MSILSQKGALSNDSENVRS